MNNINDYIDFFYKDNPILDEFFKITFIMYDLYIHIKIEYKNESVFFNFYYILNNEEQLFNFKDNMLNYIINKYKPSKSELIPIIKEINKKITL